MLVASANRHWVGLELAAVHESEGWVDGLLEMSDRVFEFKKSRYVFLTTFQVS